MESASTKDPAELVWHPPPPVPDDVVAPEEEVVLAALLLEELLEAPLEELFEPVPPPSPPPLALDEGAAAPEPPVPGSDSTSEPQPRRPKARRPRVRVTTEARTKDEVGSKVRMRGVSHCEGLGGCGSGRGKIEGARPRSRSASPRDSLRTLRDP